MCVFSRRNLVRLLMILYLMKPLNGNLILLQEEGSLFLTTKFVHARFHLNLSNLSSSCQLLQRQGVDLLQNLSPSADNMDRSTQFADDPLTIKLHELSAANSRVTSSCTTLNSLSYFEDRGDRSIFAAAVAAVTTFGLFAIADIFSSDDHRVTEHEHRISALESMVHQQTGVINNLASAFTKFLKLDDKLNHIQAFVHASELLQNTVADINQGWQLARHGILTAFLLPAESARQLYTQVTKLGNMGISSPEDIYTLPSSVLMDKNGPIVVVHCPLISSPKLNIMWPVNEPVLLPNARSLVALVNSNWIARHPSDVMFLEGSPNTLKHCLRHANFFFCKGLIWRRDVHASCLASLAFHHQAQAARLCTWERSNRTWAAATLNNGSALVSTLEQISLTEKCGDSSLGLIIPPGVHEMKPKTNCSVDSSIFFIPAESAADSDAETIIVVANDTSSLIHDLVSEASAPPVLPPQNITVHPLPEHEVLTWHYSVPLHGISLLGLLLVIVAALSAAYLTRRRWSNHQLHSADVLQRLLQLEAKVHEIRVNEIRLFQHLQHRSPALSPAPSCASVCQPLPPRAGSTRCSQV